MHIYNNNGKAEEVKEERWGWGVVYRDGTELKQFGDDGIFHRFAEIDQERVAMFVMIKPDGTGRVDMPLPEGVQIFHFYRQLVLNANTPEEKRITIYCFGWKDKKTKAEHYHFILPDDRMVTAPCDVDLTKFGI